MSKFALPAIISAIAVGLIALLAFGVSGHSDAGSLDARVASGRYPLVPEYTTELPVLNSSRTLNLASFRGRIVVVNIFASWCPPCAAEAPILDSEQKLLIKHHATILGVTYEDASTSTEQFVRRYHIDYPIVRDVSGNFVNSLGADGFPETFVIDRQGRIQAIRREQLTAWWLTHTLAPLLARPA